MKDNVYRLFVNKDEEYHIAETSMGIYEKMKIAQLYCTAIPDPVKNEIIKEFNLSDVELTDVNKYGIKELYEKYLGFLFIDAPVKFDSNNFNLAEFNRAARDFLAKAVGN